MLTTKSADFGKTADKKFGGPSVLMSPGSGIYSTTMYKLAKWDKVSRGSQAQPWGR